MQITCYDENSIILFMSGVSTAGGGALAFTIDPKMASTGLVVVSDNYFHSSRISTGPLDAFGERTCDHIVIDGSISLRPPNTDGATDVLSQLRGTRSSRYITHLGTIMTNGEHLGDNGNWISTKLPFGQSYLARVWSWDVLDGFPLLHLACYYFEKLNGVDTTVVRRFRYQVDMRVKSNVKNRYQSMTVHRYTGLIHPEPVDSTTPYGFSSWRMYQGFSFGSPIPIYDVDSIIRRVRDSAFWFKRYLSTPSSTLMGDLTSDCVSQCKVVDTNLYTLLPEIINLGNAVKSTASTLAALNTPTLRKLADAELSLKYGVQLTVKDVMSIYKSLRKTRSKRNRCLAVHSVRTSSEIIQTPVGPITAEYTDALKVWYDPSPRNPFRAAAYAGYAYSAIPTIANLWDMVPYSFVLDWFVDVGKTCDQIDSGVFLSTLDIKSSIHGHKTVVRAPITNCPDLKNLVTGSLTYKFYSRGHVVLQPPTPSLSAATGPFHNYMEAGAIITQLATR